MGIGGLRYLFDEHVFDDGPPGDRNANVLVTERGASFGYNTLVTDMRSRYFRYSSPKNPTRSRSSNQMPMKM